jgi:hypothetical protein
VSPNPQRACEVAGDGDEQRRLVGGVVGRLHLAVLEKPGVFGEVDVDGHLPGPRLLQALLPRRRLPGRDEHVLPVPLQVGSVAGAQLMACARHPLIVQACFSWAIVVVLCRAAAAAAAAAAACPAAARTLAAAAYPATDRTARRSHRHLPPLVVVHQLAAGCIRRVEPQSSRRAGRPRGDAGGDGCDGGPGDGGGDGCDSGGSAAGGGGGAPPLPSLARGDDGGENDG